MSKNLLLQLEIKAKDYASRIIKQIDNSVQQGHRGAQQGARGVEQAARTTQQSLARLSQARTTLGMRAEREVQREITRTIAAYNRLARSGTASSQELARASRAMRDRVRELNAELGKGSAGQKFGNMAKGVAAIGGGLIAAKHVLTPAMDNRKQWDANVSKVALQAFGDKDKKYIMTEGVAQIQQAVVDTVNKVGGNHDNALNSLNAMMVNGLDFGQAVKMMGKAQKMVVAGESTPEDIGALIKVLSDYGFKGDDLTNAFEHALRSGMDGKFEIADMVGALPSILATAKNVGFTGMKDFDYILAWLQSSADKSGTNSEAANNVLNTLNKMTSADTAKRLSSIENPDKKGKAIDWANSTLEGRKLGMNPIEVMTLLADKLLGSDAQYRKLEKKLASAKEEDKAQIQAQLDLKKGQVLSLLLPDVQAKSGLNAATDKASMDKRLSNTSDKALISGLNDTRFDVTSNTDLAVEERAKSLEFLNGKLDKNLTKVERLWNDWKINLGTENGDALGVLSDVKLGFGAVAAAAGVAAVALASVGGVDLRSLIRGKGAGRTVEAASRGASAMTGAATGAGSVGTVARGAGFASRLGGVLSIGSKALGGAGIVMTAMELGEQAPRVAARREMEDEKRAEAKAAFTHTMQRQAKPTMGFAYGNGEMAKAMGSTSKGVPLYGGYALAQTVSDDQVAKARYELGGYSQAELNARLERNAVSRQSYIRGNPSDKSVTNGAQETSRLTLSLKDLSTQQGNITGLMDGISTNFSQYHSEIQSLAQTIPTAIEVGLSSQSHTLQNHLVVELDGHQVAQMMSDRQFQFFKRG
ncbi:hypothetical protein A4G19_03770 [Pasteurellaceae bacterium Macca]|nr:hypothetical protein [Pasteurellaceae bacterium Macca]